MSVETYDLYFLEDNVTPLQKVAFDAVSGYEDLQPFWISNEDAVSKFKDGTPKNSCFIFGRFTGKVFDHFKAMGASIYGPQVVLDYIREEKPLPNVPYPLFSTALRNATVTVTSVTGLERERLFSSVEMLHGSALRDLTDDVNVIITPKVGSKKYIVGASLGVHILLPEWIDEAWTLSETADPIDMMQHSFLQKFKLPIFSKLIICVSGLSLEERKEVAKIVSTNGGQYSGEMQIGKTTHLVVKSAGGVKYSFAKKWKIRIVSVRWLTDSVSKGYALDETNYPIKEEGDQQRQNSTPTSSKYVHDPSVLGDISAITDSNCQRLDETRNSCLKDVTNHGLFNAPNPDTKLLSGCVVFLYGCNATESLRFSNIVKEGGGNICSKASDKVTESLTHVVMGAEAQATAPSDLEPGVFYVTGEWLEKCHIERKRLSEDDYKATFLGQHADQDDEGDETQQPMVNNVNTDEIQLINQYFCDGGFSEMDEFPVVVNEPFGKRGAQDEAPKSEIVIPIAAQLCPSAQLEGPSGEEDDITLENSGLFAGLVFKPDADFSFTAYPALSQSISDECGKVVNDSSVAADYIICSYVLRQQRPSSSHVTVYWINSCLGAKILLANELDNHVGFRPVFIPASSPLPLADCVISLSGYMGNDRSFLTDFGRALGATVQECFLRKAIPQRQLEASTHLVAARPDGRKFPASKQWGLPAVSCSWLFACGQEGRRVPIEDHPVKESDPMNPQDWSRISTTSRIQRPSLTFKETPKQSEPPVERKSILHQLRTPGWVGANADHAQTPSPSLSAALRVSPPMSEQVSRCLKTALSKTNLLPKRNLSESDFKEPIISAGILSGVVACVAKSLCDRQVSLNNLVKQLGGDFRWNFDPNVCTHMIACRSSSSVILTTASPASITLSDRVGPDVERALNSASIEVVYPDWVQECQRVGRRLPESDYRFQPPQMETPPTLTTSTLLGDVNRRLESVMGLKAQPFTENGADGGIDTQLVARRSRRAPRRVLSGTFINDGGSSPVNSNAYSNPAPVDYAHPAQSLQVRWQYEDAPRPRSELPSPCPPADNANSSQPTAVAERTSLKRMLSAEMPPSVVPPQMVASSPASVHPNMPRVFSLSGINQDERVRYQAIISELGGELDSGMAITDATTHLIIHTPSRCEKFLMSLAAGKWILHKSYLDACATALTWLHEDAYEWGGPGTEPLLVQLSPAPSRNAPPGTLSCGQLRDLAKAARYWRIAGGNAFADWRVIFGSGCDRESSFRRIIEIGRGKVLASSQPYPPPDQVTHAFTKRRPPSASSAETQVGDLSPAYEWLRVEFLCAHLTGMGSASRSEFTLRDDHGDAHAVKRSRLAR